MIDALVGRGVVVTGAGQGIGRALAVRLAAEGARVVVNDLDAAAAVRVATQTGGYAVAGDCGSARGVTALITRAQNHLGRVDIFCANAGIERTAVDSLQTEDRDWAQMLETNVMGHVRAARALVPSWLADGHGGRFVVVASAAGLLTMLGSAPYSVTKHAAIGFAEWLSATYGDKGVTVQAICPQSVDTKMLQESGPAKELLPADDTMSPEEVVESWIESLADNRFLVLPHPQVARFYTARATDTDRWLRGMRRLQERLDNMSGLQ
jgi:NAD(P)-dependent dehydrogenase (short-subunit alcohol dehydrogenase family)